MRPTEPSRPISTPSYSCWAICIVRFTGHDNGAVYGAPKKRLDGVTHLKNLFLCGTDQGFVGIIGTITSARFEGMGSIDRVNLIWNILDGGLTAEDFPHIATQSRFTGRKSDFAPTISAQSSDADKSAFGLVDSSTVTQRSTTSCAQPGSVGFIR